MWQPSPPLNGGAWLDQLEGLATTLLRLGKQSDHSIWAEIKTELKIKVKKNPMILLTLTLLTFLIILADHFHMRNYIGEIIELGLCIQKKWAEVCLFVFCFCFVKF